MANELSYRDRTVTAGSPRVVCVTVPPQIHPKWCYAGRDPSDTASVHSADSHSAGTVARRAVAAALVLSPLVGCTAAASEPTTVVFDGETYTLEGPVSCVRKVDSTLVINAPVPKWGGGVPGGGKRLIRVELTEASRLVVNAAGIRINDIRGFANDPAEMWATKADNAYTINGRMPAADGETQSHQFKIQVTCLGVDQQFHDVGPPSIGAP
jgi:Mycobacterium 19 kDa lipoprotein antigen